MRAVFARAAERQRRDEVASAPPGLSLAEMQEVAAAAGIDPTHVAAAVAELAAAPEPLKRIAGVPVQVTRVRRLAVPVSDEGWARMVSELRRTFNDDGIAGQLGRIREWSAVGRGPRRDMTTKLSLEPDDEGARVTIRQSARDFAFGFTLASGIMSFMTILFGTMASLGVDDELWIPTLAMGSLAIVFLFTVQIGMRIWASRAEKRFESLLDRLELIARADAAGQPAPAGHARRVEAVAPAVPAPTPHVAASGLGLDALPDEPERESGNHPSRRTRA